LDKGPTLVWSTEGSGGAAGHITDQLGAYAQFSYSTNIGGDYVRRFGGMVGLRFTR